MTSLQRPPSRSRKLLSALASLVGVTLGEHAVGHAVAAFQSGQGSPALRGRVRGGMKFSRGEAQLFFWSLVFLAAGGVFLAKDAVRRHAAERLPALVGPADDPAPWKPAMAPPSKPQAARSVDLTEELPAPKPRKRATKSSVKPAPTSGVQHEVVLE